MPETKLFVDPVFMHRALQLAKKSRPSPNPRVGAVLVRDGNIIGEGFHERPGMPHAEIVAINNAKNLAKEADLYVTLEPCSHQGRTGPCVEAILEAGIRRVIIGMVDPDPKVNGRGVKRLREKQVQVATGVAEDDCKELLEAYTFHRKHGRPFVTLKAATTLDGMLASTTGNSKWISSEASRVLAHQMRAECDAVLVGIETVLKDDPELTVRKTAGENPQRIVLDSHLRTPITANILKNAKSTPVLLVHTTEDADAQAKYQHLDGVLLLQCPGKNQQVHLETLLLELGRRGILSLLVEGGGIVHGAFAKARLANKIALFLSPRILGSGRSWISFPGVQRIADGIQLQELKATSTGCDILIEGRLDSNTD